MIIDLKPLPLLMLVLFKILLESVICFDFRFCMLHLDEVLSLLHADRLESSSKSAYASSAKHWYQFVSTRPSLLGDIFMVACTRKRSLLLRVCMLIIVTKTLFTWTVVSRRYVTFS